MSKTVKVTLNQDHFREFVSQRLGVNKSNIYITDNSTELEVFIKNYKRSERTKLK